MRPAKRAPYPSKPWHHPTQLHPLSSQDIEDLRADIADVIDESGLPPLGILHRFDCWARRISYLEGNRATRLAGHPEVIAKTAAEVEAAGLPWDEPDTVLAVYHEYDDDAERAQLIGQIIEALERRKS